MAQVMPARLLMVGDGPDRSSAEWLVNSKGIQSRVQFLGKQERVHELLPRWCDVPLYRGRFGISQGRNALKILAGVPV